MLGFFVSETVNHDGRATMERINILCDIAGMTPLNESEAYEIKDFLLWLGPVMARKAKEKNMLPKDYDLK